MKTTLLFIISLLSISAFATSTFLDDAKLSKCGGEIQLRRADNEKLSLKFTDNKNCNKFQVTNASGSETFKTYKLEKGSSTFTLSNEMDESYEANDKLKFVIYDSSFSYYKDKVELVKKGKVPSKQYRKDIDDKKFTGWALSNSGKCSYYQNGGFHHHAKASQQEKCK
jgi:hypothetical protein